MMGKHNAPPIIVPVAEIEHRAPKRGYAHGETETDMLKEHAVFVDPISVARMVEPGTYYLVRKDDE